MKDSPGRDDGEGGETGSGIRLGLAWAAGCGLPEALRVRPDGPVRPSTTIHSSSIP